MKEKVVLAYSGGLDTTAIIPWLKENFDYDVICVCADCGQGEELDGLEERAISCGASKLYIEDITDEFCDEYIVPCVKAHAVYENKYLLGTSMARPLIAKKLVEIARKEGAVAICHGATGKGNDQIRFELAIKALAPDSLTVHALAIKRAAKFGQEGRTMDLHSEISGMVEDAAECAEEMGLKPYYLYRQKNIAGNFENVGYAEVDKAGIYNILIMEEKQTILAAGAGASTKLVLPEKIQTAGGKKTNLIRIENVKNIMEYIHRIDEMIERKGEWLWH